MRSSVLHFTAVACRAFQTDALSFERIGALATSDGVGVNPSALVAPGTEQALLRALEVRIGGVQHTRRRTGASFLTEVALRAYFTSTKIVSPIELTANPLWRSSRLDRVSEHGACLSIRELQGICSILDRRVMSTLRARIQPGLRGLSKNSLHGLESKITGWTDRIGSRMNCKQTEQQ